MAEEPRFSADVVAELKQKHDPEMIDVLLTHSDDLDFDEIVRGVMRSLATKKAGPSPFDEIALERRRHEADMIKHEVRIFEEMGNLMTQVTDRYAALTGVRRAGQASAERR